MESPHLTRPVSRDRGVGESFTMRSRTGGEMDSTVNGPSTRGTDENRSPATLPRAFEGMLKTTTETGDIGMFSIKPSRIPQSMSTTRRIGASYNENGSQKLRQTFQPFGVPNVDDRRRLPSYTRDATSDVISMYETAGQKSASRVFDDPDYRSYSMTQTSYSAYTLSNHRSYASLRSQQDSNGLMQRQRSPFAYPARLKRPGFRPSSPALTDGGVVDYSRRAEIDRTTYGRHATSSPSSLYAQKRKPPLSLRQEANRSTPSLLSQSSPPRRSPSPGLRQSSGNIAYDWSRRNGSTSGNTSPARSTFSLASTVNLYATVSGTSNNTTPGKLAPSSPLYYDYTEDFELDGYNRASESLGSPPQFSIDETIPEERPISAEQPPSTESRVHRLSNNLRAPSSPTPTPTIHNPLADAQTRRTALPSEGEAESSQPLLGKSRIPAQQLDDPIDKKIIRLSGLGCGAQALSTHVEEAFGLLPTKSFEVSVSQTDSENVTSGNLDGGLLAHQGSKIAETKCLGGFPNRVENHPPRLSSLPSARSGPRTDAIATPEAEQSVNNSLHTRTSPNSIQLPRTSTPLADRSRTEGAELAQGSDSTPAWSSSQSRLRPSSGYKPIDTGFTELTDLIKALEESNRARNNEMVQPVFITPQKTPILAHSFSYGSMLRSTDINHGQIPLISSFNRSNAKEHHISTQVPPSKRTQPNGGGRKVESSALGASGGCEPPNFSHQMAVRVIPRSVSPMLAPKPISPARQLKLKNSVPQLMKALPPLPPEPSVRAISPAKNFRSPGSELPCRFSPLLPELSDTPVQETHFEPDNFVPSPWPPVPTRGETLKAPVNFGPGAGEANSTEQPPASDSPTIPQPPPRLKLKMKSLATLRPISPPNPKPWEREESYPWSTPDPEAHVSRILQSEKSANQRPPKFRLKITRASGSTHGTVCVNREPGESKAAAGFHLRNHKDLFTSTAGIDNIFRQVSQHLHSRKVSATSNTGSESLHPSASMLSPNLHLIPKITSPTTDFNISQPWSTKPLPSPEARSVFSDDSSHIQGHSNMRGRLSNLRARIAVPYVNRIGSQSYDDLTWRDHSRTEGIAPIVPRSASSLHSSRKSTESSPLRRFAERIQHHRLKEKVQGWLKGARWAIKSRMKSRSTTGSGQIEVCP